MMIQLCYKIFCRRKRDKLREKSYTQGKIWRTHYVKRENSETRDTVESVYAYPRNKTVRICVYVG